jgi:hypothetical protein
VHLQLLPAAGAFSILAAIFCGFLFATLLQKPIYDSEDPPPETYDI